MSTSYYAQQFKSIRSKKADKLVNQGERYKMQITSPCGKKTNLLTVSAYDLIRIEKTLTGLSKSAFEESIK